MSKTFTNYTGHQIISSLKLFSIMRILNHCLKEIKQVYPKIIRGFNQLNKKLKLKLLTKLLIM